MQDLAIAGGLKRDEALRGWRVVALKVSVIATSLLGSAPWSPLPLTVEVTA